MKNLRYWAVYLILWLAALSLAVINNATGNHAAWRGLMVGETRNTDPREIVADQLASISLFLAIGIPCMFYPQSTFWGVPWFVPSVVCTLSFLCFSIRLYSLKKKRKTSDAQEDN